MKTPKTCVLSKSDVALLARMPITCGSQPPLKTRKDAESWDYLMTMKVIDGAPAVWFVRWGLLSIGQYRRVEKARRSNGGA